MEAAKALAKTGDIRTVESFVLALQDIDEKVRKIATEALGKIRSTKTVELLIHALKEGKTDFWLIIKILRKIVGDPKVVELLIQALKDQDEKVRTISAKALQKIDWQPMNDVERAWYLIGWGRISECTELGKVAVEPLVQVLKYQGDLYQEKAAEALGKIGDARAVEPLILALRDDYYEIRRKSAEALGRIGDARAVEPLVQALRDRDEEVRIKAAEVLGKIGDARVVEPLIEVLKYGKEELRRKAAEALGRIGDVRAEEPFILALKDKDEEVRKMAAESLAKIGDARLAETLMVFVFDDAYVISKGKSGWIEKLKSLFGDYTWLIVKAASLKIKSRSSKGRYGIDSEFYNPHDEYEYDLCDAMQATGKLCEIHTIISNNILHLIQKRKDIEVKKAFFHVTMDAEVETFDFESQRALAREEVRKRGNPPYDPSVYLNKKSWKL
jgi:HEAT repeat protein/predicted CopG family antitoxin